MEHAENVNRYWLEVRGLVVLMLEKQFSLETVLKPGVRNAYNASFFSPFSLLQCWNRLVGKRRAETLFFSLLSGS